MKLPSELKEKAQLSRDALAQTIAIYEQNVKELATLEDNKPKLETEIADIESSVVPDDETAINRVLRLREKLRLTGNRIGLIQRNIEEARPKIKDAAESVRAMIREALRPEYEKLIQEATNAFSPFYIDRDRPGKLADQSDAAREFFYFIQGPARLDKEDPGFAKSELAILDVILSGKNPWQFSSKK